MVKYPKFGERLRSLREEKGISQELLAELIGSKTRTTISMYESGQRAAKFEFIYEIAKVLDVNIAYLIGESDERTTYRG